MFYTIKTTAYISLRGAVMTRDSETPIARMNRTYVINPGF